ncbi:MAG: CPBP family glutamic-type intramembrane protease [Verrucomicrobiota bacterium]|nr:CPBP family glutamic-type intramembrane protease [Verrucomicrobiota bacterium]
MFFLLVAGSVLGVLALLPYLTVVLGPTLATRRLPLPLPLLALIQGVSNFSVAAGLGLFFARKLGLGAPVLEAWLYRRPITWPPHFVLISCVIGAVSGAVTLGLVHSRLGAVLTAMPVASEAAMPIWKRLLACFYGALCEEVLTRLFLLSLVIWLLRLLSRSMTRSGGTVLFWIANVVVAIAFGAGHLPLAARIAPLTVELVRVVVALNALIALPFGYLYWRRGLEAAMLAHFAADVVLHVLGPVVT